MKDDGRADDVAAALRSITPPRFLCGARALADAPIHPGERVLYIGVHASVRRATSTGRWLAREVLHDLGVAPEPLLRTDGGAPHWPVGVAGSIAHDDEFAVCVIGAGVNSDIGVDIEPAAPLPAEILSTVLVTADERDAVVNDLVGARLIFCAKEAVYKMCYPAEHRFYEFDDILMQRPIDKHGPLPRSGPVELEFLTSTGRRARVVATREPRLLAVATLEVITADWTG